MIIKIEKRFAYIIIGLLVLIFGFLVVNAYGGNQPSVMGHSAGEIDGVCKSDGTDCLAETDPTITQDNIKDGITWTEISSRPAGLDDGDDIGSGGQGCNWVGWKCSAYVLSGVNKYEGTESQNFRTQTVRYYTRTCLYCGSNTITDVKMEGYSS